jgi:hypothetical protein
MAATGLEISTGYRRRMMDELGNVLKLLKDGHGDAYIAKAMKPYRQGTQSDRLDLVQNYRRAFYSIHGYANPLGKYKGGAHANQQ